MKVTKAYNHFVKCMETDVTLKTETRLKLKAIFLESITEGFE